MSPTQHCTTGLTSCCAHSVSDLDVRACAHEELDAFQMVPLRSPVEGGAVVLRAVRSELATCGRGCELDHLLCIREELWRLCDA